MHAFKHLVAVFLILFAVESAYACMCLTRGEPCDSYGESAAIFVGRVVGSLEHQYVEKNGNKVVYDVGAVKFLIQENFKGAPGYQIEINAGLGAGDCGFMFLRNESYIVYAYKSSEDNKLYTSICTRTKHVSEAKEDLDYLRGIANLKPGATLYGRLKQLIGDPEHGPVEEGPRMAGIKIIVTGEGRSTETTTNDAGEYRVTGLPPGDYDAFPQLPANLGVVSDRDNQDNIGRFTGRTPVRLTDRSCGELSFIVQFSGVIGGKVVDANGEPVKEAELNLIAGDDDERHWWAWTDKEGNYEFRMVQPGSYLLGFNLKWAPDKDDPYPRTFYPGVKSRSEAALITIGEGEKLKGYDLTLPPRLSERQVKVTVVWPDGSPAANVTVRYEVNDASSLWPTVKTSDKGTAVLSLFDNYHYIIFASAERDKKNTHSAPIEVFVGKKLKPIRLVLDKDGFGTDAIEALKRKSPK
jgi:carboxypeptidase family protein